MLDNYTFENFTYEKTIRFINIVDKNNRTIENKNRNNRCDKQNED